MSEYFLLIRDDMNYYLNCNTAELKEIIERMTAWSRELRDAGIHRGAEKLSDDPGKIIRGKGGAQVTDGPYSETKELVGGYFMIAAKSYEEAVRIARGCPALDYASSIEVRHAGDCEDTLQRANTARD